MLLYHGSNVVVRDPKIIVSNRALDFGAGFYTTSSEPQAIRWAKVQAFRRRMGEATVSIYEFDEKAIEGLHLKRFHFAGDAWLHFVVQNRKGIYRGYRYDVVIGPVANDNTMTVINDYMLGAINEETALVLLKPQKLADQFVFLTYRGIASIKYVGMKTYG